MGLIKRKKVCYVCGTANTEPHHVIPQSEGGLPISDNIVWMCNEHHNAVEGSFRSVGTLAGAWDRIKNAKLDWIAEHRPQPKTYLDFREEKALIPGTTGRLDYLTRLRANRGYLDPSDAKEYQFLLAKNGRMNPLSTVCLWNYPDLHAKALAEISKGGPVSDDLKTIEKGAQRVIDSYLKSLAS